MTALPPEPTGFKIPSYPEPIYAVWKSDYDALRQAAEGLAETIRLARHELDNVDYRNVTDIKLTDLYNILTRQQ